MCDLVRMKVVGCAGLLQLLFLLSLELDPCAFFRVEWYSFVLAPFLELGPNFAPSSFRPIGRKSLPSRLSRKIHR